jgi:hypothetical protein
VKEFLRACGAYAGGQPGETLRQLTGGFVGRARDDANVLASAAAALKTLPPRGASWLAVAIGAAVEGGANAELSARAIVDLLLSWLPQLPAAEGSMPTPQQTELLEAFEPLAQSVVAHLARTDHLKSTLSQDLPLLDRLAVLEEYTAGAAWIREALLRSSGSLILLHAPSRRAFQLEYANVATCFHLFSLLQTAVGEQIPGGRKPDPLIANVARGNSQEKVTDEAWWHYGDPRSKVASVAAMIFGEGLVREIPTVAGERVIVLWPPMLASRGWDSSFFGPQLDALKPNALVRAELSTADSAAWADPLLKKPSIAGRLRERFFSKPRGD